MITKNLGEADRIIRVIVSLALGVAAYRAEGPAMFILGAAAAVSFISGAVGWCGLYALMGVRTCKIDKP